MGNKFQLVFRRTLRPNFLDITRGVVRRFNKHLFFLDEQGIIKVYIDEGELNEKSKELLDKYVNNYSLFEEEKDRVLTLYKESLDWAREVRRRGFKNLTNEERSSILLQLRHYFQKIGESMWLFHFLLQQKIEDYLLKRGLSGLKFTSTLSYALEIPEPTITWTANMKLYELAMQLSERMKEKIFSIIEDQRKIYPPPGSYSFLEENIIWSVIEALYEDEETRKMCDDYIFEYGVFKNYDYGDFELLNENIIEGSLIGEGKSELKLKIYRDLAKLLIVENIPIKIKVLEVNRERVERLKDWFREIAGLCEKKEYSVYSDMLSWSRLIRFRRRETITSLDYYIAPLFKYIIDEYNEKQKDSNRINERDIRYLELTDFIKMVNELSEGKKYGNYNEKIRTMKSGWVETYEKEYPLVGNEAKRYIEDLIRSKRIPPPPSSDELKGFLRYPGKEKVVEGKVVKIKNLDELREKVGRGDILVTFMPHPAWTDFLDRFKAIITDEGGLNCHILTIYFEFQWKIGEIPIITDAKGVMDVIEDGEKIRLDFERVKNGEVKIEVV